MAAPAAAQQRPNILIVNTDDQRAAGTMQVMPQTREWLTRGGTTFTRAHATTPLCCPSRVSMFTGQYAHNHGVLLNNDSHQIDQGVTVQRYLHDAGYATGIVGKFVNNFPIESRPRYWDDAWTTLGGYRDTLWNLNGRIRTVPTYSTTFIRQLATRFVRSGERRDRRPWFLYVAPTAPHGPLDPQARFAQAPVGPFPRVPGLPELDLSDKPPYLARLVDRFPPPPTLGADVRAGQLRLLMSVDLMMGALRRELARRGELGRTLVVFTSDNGLLWGERGGLVLKDLPYRESTQVPMLLSWPGHVAPGSRDDRLVANIDLAPTALDAAGAPLPQGPPMDGRSLLDPARRSSLLLEYGGLDDRIPPWTSVLTDDGRQYVESPLGVADQVFREYYDRSDPLQLENPLGTLSPLDDPDTRDLRAALHGYEHCAGGACP